MRTGRIRRARSVLLVERGVPWQAQNEAERIRRHGGACLLRGNVAVRMAGRRMRTEEKRRHGEVPATQSDGEIRPCLHARNAETSGLITAAPDGAGFLARLASAARRARRQSVGHHPALNGRNDGLTPSLPIDDDAYSRHRKTAPHSGRTTLQAQQPGRLARRDAPRGQTWSRTGRPGDRRRGRLSEPEPITFREHGDLANRPNRSRPGTASAGSAGG